MPTSRLIAIGDVHGCVLALDTVLEAIEPAPGDRLIFLGDMIDQGRESRDVLERIIALRKRCDVVLIQGNHEEMMYAAREDEKALRYWENCGGVATINSYRFGGTLADIPAEHWRLLNTCLPYYETDECIFSHANYLPDLPMAQQSEFSLRWELFDRRSHGTKERRDPRPRLCRLHRYAVLQVRLAYGLRRVKARSLASQPLGHPPRLRGNQPPPRPQRTPAAYPDKR
jgi:serine/threonine protein phosphatase 1